MRTQASCYGGNPPVHPIAYHAGTVQESLRITDIIRSLFDEVRTAVRNFRQYRENRAAFQHLLSLDDTMLKDIGLTRSDVVWANNLPLSVNASTELEIVARSSEHR